MTFYKVKKNVQKFEEIKNVDDIFNIEEGLEVLIYLKASYIGWFKIQCVWSSVIQGLEGPG